MEESYQYALIFPPFGACQQVSHTFRGESDQPFPQSHHIRHDRLSESHQTSASDTRQSAERNNLRGSLRE